VGDKNTIEKRGLSRRDFLRLAATAGAGAALAACTPEVVKETVIVEKPVEKVVKETVIVGGTPEVVEKVVTATPAPLEKIVLTHPCKWLGEGDNRYDAAIKVLALYQERRPDVEVEIIPNPDKNETLKKIQADCAAGDCPDLFERASLALWESGWLLDLAPFIDDAWKARLLPESLELTSWQGRIFGIGTETSPIPCFWNTKLLGEIGAEVPATWDECLDVGEKLKSTGRYLSTFAIGLNNHWPNNACFRRPGAAEAMGNEEWENEHALFAIERMKDVYDGGYHPANDLDMGWRDAVPLFQNGQMALFMNGAWALDQQIDAEGVDPELKDNVIFSAFPATGPEGTSIEYKMSGSLGLGHHLANQPRKLDSALDWARVWTSVEASIIWAVDGRANMGVIVPQDQWDAALEQVPLFKKFMDAAASADVAYSLGSRSKKVQLRSWNMWNKAKDALLLGKSMDEAVAEYVKWMEAA